MVQTYHNTGTYQADYTKFGGFIYPSDFNTDCRGKGSAYGSAIAGRIAQDQNFDNQCRKNIEQRQTTAK